MQHDPNEVATTLRAEDWFGLGAIEINVSAEAVVLRRLTREGWTLDAIRFPHAEARRVANWLLDDLANRHPDVTEAPAARADASVGPRGDEAATDDSDTSEPCAWCGTRLADPEIVEQYELDVCSEECARAWKIEQSNELTWDGRNDG